MSGTYPLPPIPACLATALISRLVGRVQLARHQFFARDDASIRALDADGQTAASTALPAYST